MADAEDKVSYKSPYYDKLDAQAEQKYGLPKGLLTAVRTRGEASNADQISSAGAQSVYQIIPDTRDRVMKQTGRDAYLNPENAADTAGYLLKGSLDRNKGNPVLAVAEYHGGTKPENWGPVTQAYVRRVTGERLAGGDTPKQSTLERLEAKRAAADTPSIARVYDAYKSGRMDAADAAQFEADVSAGKVLLPRGAKVKASAPAPDTVSTDAAGTMAPQGVIDAYQNQAMSPEESREFEQDVEAGRVKVPAGVTVGKPSGTLGHIAESAAEAVSGAKRETEQSRNLPDWAGMPELGSLTAASAKTGLGTFFAGPKEAVAVIKHNYPDTKVAQDSKGNYLLTSSLDGQQYAIKPGFTWGDVPKALGYIAALTPTGEGAQGLIGAAAQGAAVQTAAEATQAATGGEFNPSAIAEAAAGNALVPGAAKLLEAAKPAVVGAVDAIRGGKAGVMPPHQRGEPPALEGEYIPASQPGANTYPGAQLPSGQRALPAPAAEVPPGVPPNPAAAAEAAAPQAAAEARGTAVPPPPVPPAEPAPAAPGPGGAPPVEPVAPGMTVPESTVAPAAGGGTLSAEELAHTARKASGGGFGSGAAKETLATEVAPDAATLESARRLGIEEHLQPGHVTTNAAYRTLDATLKSIPGSELKAAEVAGMTKVAERADALVNELGGTHDLSMVDATTKSRMQGIHDDLKAQAKQLFDAVAEKVKPTTPAPADNVLAFINKRAENLGGAEHLGAGEKDILSKLSPKNGKQPTYALLDQVRKDINEAAFGKTNVFATSDSKLLGDLAHQLRADQTAVADAAGAGDLWKAANATTVLYKGVQDDLKSLFGKELDKSIIGPLSTGVKRLATGDVSGFTRLIKSVPESLRREVVASGLTSAFDSVGKRGGLNFNSYVNWFEGLQKNTVARDALFSNLPPGATQRLTDLYKVSKGITASTNQQIHTGRLLAAPVKEILEADNLFSHIMGIAKKAGLAEAATSSVGLPGVGMAAAIAQAVGKGRTSAMDAAAAMLNSQEFILAARRGNPADLSRLAKSSRFAKFVKAAGNPAAMKDPVAWLKKARNKKEGPK